MLYLKTRVHLKLDQITRVYCMQLGRLFLNHTHTQLFKYANIIQPRNLLGLQHHLSKKHIHVKLDHPTLQVQQ